MDKLFKLQFFHYYVTLIYPPPSSNHHCVVRVHESFLFGGSLDPLTFPLIVSSCYSQFEVAILTDVNCNNTSKSLSNVCHKTAFLPLLMN